MLPEIEQEALDGFTDRFLNEGMADNGLLFAGGISESVEGFIRLDKRGSVTEEYRTLVRDWLAKEPLVADVELGELIDAREGILAFIRVSQDEGRQSRPGILTLPHIV